MLRPAIRRAIMPSGIRERATSSSSSRTRSRNRRLQPRLSKLAQGRIHLRRQPPRRPAGEPQQFRFSPRRSERPVSGFANDRGVIAVGDDEPRFAWKVAFLFQDLCEMRRDCPEKPIAILEIVGPFAVSYQIRPSDLDLDDGE